MKVVFLADASSIHTVRWVNGLIKAGYDVHLISQHAALGSLSSNVKIYLIPYYGICGYFFMVPRVRKLINRIKPDILNAHYASGYGTTARLVNYHPWVLSVWGSDVYDFPNKSFFHNWLIKQNLNSADQVASTSHCMAAQTRTLLPKLDDIAITPFGVELDSYAKLIPKAAIQMPKLVIGTVKTMSFKYGVDTLIESYALLLKLLKTRSNTPELELRLVGGGEQTAQLQELVERLKIADSVNFIGQVPHAAVPQELAKLDIYVALSRLDSESFGVAIIEASAAGLPVIVSDAGGLPEVTIDGETGFVVRRDDPDMAAKALEKLVMNAELRYKMGVAGQTHVAIHYSWDTCIEIMQGVYHRTIEKQKKIKK